MRGALLLFVLMGLGDCLCRVVVGLAGVDVYKGVIDGLLGLVDCLFRVVDCLSGGSQGSWGDRWFARSGRLFVTGGRWFDGSGRGMLGDRWFARSGRLFVPGGRWVFGREPGTLG